MISFEPFSVTFVTILLQNTLQNKAIRELAMMKRLEVNNRPQPERSGSLKQGFLQCNTTFFDVAFLIWFCLLG